jgi:hypothetical protein
MERLHKCFNVDVDPREWEVCKIIMLEYAEKYKADITLYFKGVPVMGFVRNLQN